MPKKVVRSGLEDQNFVDCLEKFNIQPFQDKFIFSKAQFPAMVSAWATGKTLCGIFKVFFQASAYPRSLCLIVRKHYKDLADSTVKDWEKYTGLIVNSDGDCKMPNGSLVMFRHAEQLNKLQNINLSVAMIEQAEEFDDDSQWFMLFGRMRRQGCGTPRLFIIANTNGNNWIKKLWKDRPAPGYELHEATTYDNAKNLPPEFIKNLDTLRLQKPAVYQQFVMNSWEVTSGKIFQQWDERYHVIPDLGFPSWWETFGAMDTAISSGVFCAIVFTVSPDGTIIALKEYYDKNKPISEHALGIHSITSGRRIATWWADPSCFNKTRENPKLGKLYSVADELADHGLDVLPAENDVNAGINRVIEHLIPEATKPHIYKEGVMGMPKILVCESCVNLRREMPMYREVPNTLTERGDKKWAPYKSQDHCVVGSTMVQTVCGPKPIQDLVGQDGYVYCFRHDKGRVGVSKFHSVKLTRKNTDVVRVIFDNLDSITCTPDHLFLLRNRKYMMAQDMRTGISLMPFYANVSRLKWTRVKLCKSNLASKDWAEMHRLVYEDVVGEIPDEYSIHHKDSDGFNNSPENLVAMTRHEHAVETFKERINFTYKRNCVECGEEYTGLTTTLYKRMFCSNNCKSRHRRGLGTDNEKRSCERCGDEFLSNKYSKTRFCSRSCGHAGFFNHKVLRIENAGKADTYNLHVDIVNNFAANSVFIHNSVDVLRYATMSRPSTADETYVFTLPRFSVARREMEYKQMLEESIRDY